VRTGKAIAESSEQFVDRRFAKFVLSSEEHQRRLLVPIEIAVGRVGQRFGDGGRRLVGRKRLAIVGQGCSILYSVKQ
jgi:hypothetical protein